MAVFKYKAMTPAGQEVRGVVEAYDEYEAIDKIRETCPILLKITKVKEKTVWDTLFEPLSISEKSLSILCSQMGIVIRSGVPIARAVDMIAQQSEDRSMKRLLNQVAKDVSAGHGLADSFENKGKHLPVTFIETIRAGEQSGTLEQSFDRLYTYYDKTAKIKAKVRSAMMYPCFLIFTAIVVVTIVMLVAVPVFADLFEGSGMELPAPTRLLMTIYNFLSAHIVLIVMIIAGAALGMKMWSKKSERGRRFFAWLQLKLPLIGNIAVMNGASQFANTMSTMLAAGLPAMQTMVITGRIMGNYLMGQAVSASAVGIEEGKRIVDCIRTVPYLPPMLIEMTGVGEETGSMEDTLATIGEFYDGEVERATTSALSMLEPIIVLAMAGVVGFIMIALYLPIFSMGNAIG